MDGQARPGWRAERRFLIAVEATAGCGIPKWRSPVAVGLRLAHWQSPGGVRHWPVSSPCGTGDVGGDDVGGVPVQTAAGAVVSHGGPGISMRGGFLHI